MSRLGKFVLMCSISCGLLGWGMAQTPPATQPVAPPVAFTGGTKFAAVNLVRIFDAREGCEQIKDLNSKLRVAREEAAKESDTRRKALDEAKIRLNAIPPTSPDYAPARSEFSRLNIELQAWAQGKKEELDGDEFRWMTYMYERVCVISAGVAAERNIDAVVTIEGFDPGMAGDELRNLQAQIRSRRVIFAAAHTDMTPAVIERMNKDYADRGGKASLEPARAAPAPAKTPGQAPAGTGTSGS